MTRVEPPAGERPIGRGDVTQIVRRELFLEIFRRKALSCLGYLFVVMVVFGIPAGFAAAYVAKTGFVNVPLLTDWLYRPAEPLRVVRPATAASNEVLLRTIGARSTYEPITNLLTVTVRESELSALAIESLHNAPSDELPFAIRDLQVVVDPGIVEIFAISPRGSRAATVRLRLEPDVVAGSLELKLKELRLGAADVPLGLAQFLVSSITKYATVALREQLATAGALADVRAEAGELSLVLVPAAP